MPEFPESRRSGNAIGGMDGNTVSNVISPTTYIVRHAPEITCKCGRWNFPYGIRRLGTDPGSGLLTRPAPQAGIR